MQEVMNRRKKRIMVTGANGYIGQNVINTLINLGIDVVAVDLNFTESNPRVVQLESNIFEDHSVVCEMADTLDACLHLAWRNGFNHNANTHLFDLPGHFSFIEDLVNAGLKHIAVLGSMHEVGYWEGVIDENTPNNPTTYYGIAKNALRQAVGVLTSKKNVVFQWLRAFYIIGDDRRNHSIFTKILEAEDNGQEYFPVTTGTNKFDFISIQDLSRQISLSVLQDKYNGIINCCSGKPVSLREAVLSFIEENNLRITPQFGAFPDRPYDSPAIWGDPSKINKIIENAAKAGY